MSYRGFPTVCVNLLRCPSCSGELTCKKTDSSHIDSGELRCVACSKIYPIADGIVRMITHLNIEDERKDEIAVRDEYADRYDRMMKGRYEKEIPSTLCEIGNVAGATVIEYAAGTGRITLEYASQVKMAIASDFSLCSLQVLAKKECPSNLGLVYADATYGFLRSASFDIAIASQFYEHIPSQELRVRFLRECSRVLREKGRFVSTVYHYDLRMRLRRLPKEGKHQGGIPFKYFTVSELRGEYKSVFRIDKLIPIDITLPLEARLGIPASLGGVLSRLSERIPFVRDFGHLVLVSARKA